MSSADEIGFADKLWEGMPVIFQRFKNAKLTLDQMIVRYTKNWMSEKSYFENIKSRKFQNMTDEGSLGKIWLELKDYIAVIETNSNNLMLKFKEYVDASTKDLKEYEIATKQIETEYMTVKKKKDTAIQDINKKREKYVSVFKEWDEADGEATQAKNSRGMGDAKTQKAVKTAADRFSQKESAELQYIEAVKLAQGYEKDYDNKLAELLRRFEGLELQRLNSMQIRLQEFFSLWHENTVKYAEVLNKCVIAVSNINPRDDLVAFCNQNQTDGRHPPYQLATLCQRSHGTDVSSASNSPYVAGSPSSLSTSSPLILTRAQEQAGGAIGGGGRGGGGGGGGPLRPNPVTTGVGSQRFQSQSQSPITSQSPNQFQNQNQQSQSQNRFQSTGQGQGAGKSQLATNFFDVNSQGGGNAGGGGGGNRFQQQQQQQQQQSNQNQSQGSIVVGTNEFVAAKVLVTYQATSETETNVNMGDIVMVIPDKQGQGWVYCLKQDGQGGYVPTDYVEIGRQ